MNGVTVDGIPWKEARSFGEDGPTNDELNRDCLAPLSRKHGYDLCIHPFMQMIDFTGMSCGWCDQPVTREAISPDARQLRTQAILATYPQLRKEE